MQISEDGDVKVVMTLTTPKLSCCRIFPQEVKEKVAGVENVKSVDLELTF